MLPSSGTPRGWLCTFIGMVSHVVMCKERKHLFPGTIFRIQTLKICKELCHILKSIQSLKGNSGLLQALGRKFLKVKEFYFESVNIDILKKSQGKWKQFNTTGLTR